MSSELPNRDQFLTELSALTRKHGIVIWACGCCGSPWLSKMEKAESGKKWHYSVNEMDAFMKWYDGSDDDKLPSVKAERMVKRMKSQRQQDLAMYQEWQMKQLNKDWRQE